jgi:hypothetical protein
MTKIKDIHLTCKWFVMLGGTLWIFSQATQVACMTPEFLEGAVFIVGI